MKMDKTKVIYHDEQKEAKIPTGTKLLLRRCCNAVLEMEKFSDRAEVHIYFVDSDRIRQVNAQFRNKDSTSGSFSASSMVIPTT